MDVRIEAVQFLEQRKFLKHNVNELEQPKDYLIFEFPIIVDNTFR